jgi:hypothetical protein
MEIERRRSFVDSELHELKCIRTVTPLCHAMLFTGRMHRMNDELLAGLGMNQYKF